MNVMRKMYLAAVCCSLVSCLSTEQENAVRSFGKAAASVGDFATESFPAMRQQLIEINRGLVAIVGKEGANLGNDETIDNLSYYNLDGDLDPDKIQNAVNAAKALKAYATALVAVVDYDSEKDLKDAAEKLSTSGKGLQLGGGQVFKDSEVDGFAGLVRGIGGWIVDMRRKAATTKIAKSYSEVVPKLVDALQQDFSVKGGFAVELFTKAKDLARKAFNVLDDPKATHHDRTLAISAYELALRAIKQHKRLHTKAISVLEKLDKANKNMVAVLEDDDLSIDDIKALAKSAGELVDLGKAFLKAVKE